MSVQAERAEEGLEKFDEILRRYADLLQDSHRYLYESIQKRRGVTLANLNKHANAIPILKEASGFKTLTPEEKQEVHFYLGLCYDGVREDALAKEQYSTAIDLGLGNEFEAHAHYRIAILHFKAGAFAQTKQHLEIVLQNSPPVEIPNLPRRYVYEQLSRACHHLGEQKNAEKYMQMAKRG
jgi:tetratricopeptide (TPR) repeat protein